MRAHAKPERNRLKLFRFLMNPFLVPPEPRLMHKRPMRRIHQADNSLVYMRRQITGQVRAFVSFAEFGQFRRGRYGLSRTHRRFTHIHPYAAVMLLARIMSGKNPLHLQLILARESRNFPALPTPPTQLPP